MDAIAQVTDNSIPTSDTPVLQPGGLNVLCRLLYETTSTHFDVLLEADVSEVSLEGMNKYRITVSSNQNDSEEKLRAELDINLREAMNSVSIEGNSPLYFAISNRTFDLGDLDIDSSIQEVVDMGLINYQIKSGIRPGSALESQPIHFDMVASNLIKASISALLAQFTVCHKQVIKNAGHLFASRQDYIRDMCKWMARSTDSISTSITGKTKNCEYNLL